MTETAIMTVGREGKTTGPLGSDLARLILGARAYRGQNTTTAIGTVRSRAGATVIELNAGGQVELANANVSDYGYEVARSKLDALSAGGSDDQAVTADRVVSILQACPPWARQTVAKHLAPERYAAFKADEKEARKAQLREIGAAVSGKPKSVSPKTANADASDPRAERRAQLQAIGKLASR